MKKLFLIMALFTTLTSWAGYYTKVLSADSLHAGDNIIFVYETGSKANGKQGSGKFLAAVDVTITDNAILSDQVQDITLSGSAGQWSLKADKVLGNASGSNDLSGKSVTYTITFANGNATVTSSVAGKNSNTVFFCYNAGAPRFALYAASSNQQPIQIYRKLAQPDVPVAVQSVSLSEHDVTLRVGDTKALTATILPEEAQNKNITWGSTAESVASIVNGTITAAGVGEAKVWVRTEDGNLADTCTVLVKQGLNLPAVTWNLVQSVDSLKEGTKVFFGNTAKDYVLGIYDKNVAPSNIRGVAATYGALRHSVTVSESYAYTVHKDGNNFYFVDVDGRYLCMYNTNKNLSASDVLDNHTKWTLSIDDSIATIRSVYDSSWQLLFNKTAANPLFCTYSYKDANDAEIYIYSGNAPAWVEPTLYPEMTLLVGQDTITDMLDWGLVEYDEYGLNEDHYQEAKSILVKTNKDVREAVSLRLKTAQYFTLYTTSVPAQGGSVSIQFSANSVGTYTDSLFVDCGDIHYALQLKAEAGESHDTPEISFSTRNVYLNPNYTNNNNDLQMFTFSVSNLKKNLYIKWETGTMPTWQSDKVEILAGDEDVYYEAATNMGTANRTNEEVYIDATVYQTGTYTSTLLFYTIDPTDKSKHLFDERVTITIVASSEPVTPTNLENVNDNDNLNKLLVNGQLIIIRDGVRYNAMGQIVE